MRQDDLTRIQTGYGYGVGLDVPDPITAAALAATADSDGQVPVYAYAPAAGHPWDTANADAIADAIPQGTWVRERTPLTSVLVYFVPAADPTALARAAEALRELAAGEHLDPVATADEEQFDFITQTDDDAAGLPFTATALRDWLTANRPPGYVIDGSGLSIPDLTDAVAALQQPPDSTPAAHDPLIEPTTDPGPGPLDGHGWSR